MDQERPYGNHREARKDMENLVLRYHNKKYERLLEFEAKEVRARYRSARNFIMHECYNAEEIIKGLPKKLKLNIIRIR